MTKVYRFGIYSDLSWGFGRNVVEEKLQSLVSLSVIKCGYHRSDRRPTFSHLDSGLLALQMNHRRLKNINKISGNCC